MESTFSTHTSLRDEDFSSTSGITGLVRPPSMKQRDTSNSEYHIQPSQLTIINDIIPLAQKETFFD
jgi:hypothetical protein